MDLLLISKNKGRHQKRSSSPIKAYQEKIQIDSLKKIDLVSLCDNEARLECCYPTLFEGNFKHFSQNQK